MQPQIRNAVDTVYKMSQKEYKRGVAQPGSAPVLGTGGRRFESCRPDNKKAKKSQIFLAFLLYKTPALDGLEGDNGTE